MSAGEGQCHQYRPVFLGAWEEGQMSPVKMVGICCGYKAAGTAGLKEMV